MKRTGKILSTVLILSMLLSLFTGFTYADRKFSVFVPKALSLTVDSNGTIHIPTGERARIYNASSDGAVIVKSISVEFKNGWYAEDWSANFGAKPDNAKALGLQLRGDAMGLNGRFSTTNSRWVIEPNSFIDLEMQAKIAKQTAAKSEIVAVISFTIDWAQTGVYTIKFVDAEGGTISDKSTLTTDEKGIVPTLPVANPDTLYVFDHYEDESGSTIGMGDIINEDITLHPVYKKAEPARNPIINFVDGSNGTVDDKSPIEAENGIVPELPPVTPDDFHIQTGWEDENGNPLQPGDIIDRDVILHPVFEEKGRPEEPKPVKRPVISFEDSDNGTINDKTPIEAPDGVVPALPPVTPDDCYVQTGWEDSNGNPVKPGDPIDQDVILHPVFEENKQPENPVKKPVINFEDGSNGTVDDKTPIEVPDGIVPALPSVTPDDGFEQIGWKDENGNPVQPGDAIDHDITLHPVFEEKKPVYHPVIRFEDGSNGTVDDKTPIEVTDGVVPALPSVTPDDGFEQTGWKDENGNPVQPGDAIDHDITLHPVFEEKKPVYPVIRFEDGSNGTVDDKTPIEVTDGVVPALPSVTPDDGFEQTGWRDENGNPVQPGDAIDHDITLHPVFDEVSVQDVVVSFAASKYNGTISGNTAPMTVKAGTKWSEIATPDTNEGLSATFMGWYNGDIELTDDFVINEDMTATANFMSWFTHTNDTVTGLSEAYEKAGRPVDIVVPHVIDGKKLTKIGKDALRLQKQLTGITLQEGYTRIGPWGLAQCFNVEKCILPSTLTTIETSGLNCIGYDSGGKLGELWLPSSMKFIEEKAFWGCGWTDIMVPARCEVSSSNVFSTSPYLKYLSFENGPYDFSYTFQNCPQLKTVVLPATTVTLKTRATFLYLPNLTTVIIYRASGELYDQPWDINASNSAPKANIVWRG